MIWRFGNLEIDEGRSLVKRNDRRVPLEPKAFALFVELLRAHPRPVSREILGARLWPDVTVTKASLDRAASVLRRELAAGGDGRVGVRTVRGFGYALEGEVGRVRETAAGVAREEPLQALEAALGSASEGTGEVVVVTGEPGIGKTHLVEHFVSSAASPATASIGRAVDGGAPPYWEWRTILRDVAAALPPARLRSAVRGREASLRAVAPELETVAPAGPTTRPDASPVQLWDDVARFLGDASRLQPLVLVLEDLHWAGAESLQLLGHLARHVVPEAAIVVVVTYRNRGAPERAELDAALAALFQLPRVRPLLTLVPFDEAAVAELVTLETRREDLGVMSPEITRWTGGNPLYVREVARLLASRPDGERRLEVPPGVAAVVRQRASQLGAETRHLLEVASVPTGARTLAVLARAADCDEPEAWARLVEARRAGLVELSGADGYRFTHEVLRDALRDPLPREHLVELHRRVADAIEAVHGSWLEPHLPELVFHLSESRPLVDDERLFRHARAAARQARECGSFVEEARHLRRALAATGARSSAEAARRCDVLLDLAGAETQTGQGDLAASALEEASAIARGLGDGRRLGRAALMHSAWAVPILADPEAIALLEEALSVLGDDAPELSLRLKAQLALQRRFSGDRSEGDRLLGEILRESDRIEDPQLRAMLRAAHLDAVQQGSHHESCEERLWLADRALADAIDASATALVLQIRRHRISILCELGDSEQIEREIRQFERSPEDRSRSQRYYAAAFRAGRQLVEGRFDAAREQIARAEALADPRDPSESLFTPTTQRIQLPLSSGEAETLAATIEAIIEGFPIARGWRTGLGLVYLQQGRCAEAQRLLDADLDRGVAAFLLDNMTDTMVLAAFTTISHELGDLRHAAELYALLEPHRGRNVDVGYGIACYGAVDYYRALAATMMGRHGEALELFAAASALHRRSGLRLWEVRNRVAWSRLLADSHRSADRDRARSLAAEAHDLARQLGLEREATRLQEVLSLEGLSSV